MRRMEQDGGGWVENGRMGGWKRIEEDGEDADADVLMMVPSVP